MRRRAAFTLIEILVVIAIIGILSTLLIVGISHLKISANRQQTHQILQNCESLYRAYDAAQHLHYDQFEIDSPGNVTADFESQYEISNPSALGPRIGLQVAITRALFTQMRSLPNIRSSMDQFPAGRMFLPKATTGANIGTYAVFNTQLSPWGPSASQPYLPGINYVTYAPPGSGLPPVAYLAIKKHYPSDGTVVSPLDPPGSAPQPYNGPPDTGCWFSLLGDPNVPVLLDAWGNPIIVVLGGVFGDGPIGTYGYSSGAGYVTAGGVQTQVIAPDQRLFFASAGPDGDFSKGDDNLYSFDPK